MDRRVPDDADVGLVVDRGFADKMELSKEAPQPKEPDESSEIGTMLRRVLRAMVRRATAGDLEALRELHLLELNLLSAVVDAARGAHDGPARYSWTEIAAELGVSRQAARQRFKEEL
jgi:hypothetical protein